MKNLICLLTLSASLILWNCKKDRPIEINTVKEPPIETPTELNVRIEKYGLVYVTNYVDCIKILKWGIAPKYL